MIHLLVALLFAVQPLPEPPVTTFAQHCYTLTDGAFTVSFGYTSNAERHFVGDGFDFVTQVGVYPDAFALPAGELPAPNLQQVSLIELVSTGDPALDMVNGEYGEQVTLVFDWATLPECGHETEFPSPLPVPFAEPMPVETCDRQAIDGATGLPYCYSSQGSGVIPLPPAYQ